MGSGPPTAAPALESARLVDSKTAAILIVKYIVKTYLLKKQKPDKEKLS